MTSRQVRLWQRAAVYGSLWAAVEIVVGSFLHNLRIPFAGSVLSAVGVVILTASHRASPEKGLIWRTALVCALMKSVSPSAVILGPMVGILMEGILLESSVRIFRGRVPGYLVGGALAVSWSMAQRVLNAIVAFGTDVVRLYVDAYGYASRSLGVSSFGPFDLIATLVVLEMCTGVAAALFGLRVARRAGTAASAIPTTAAAGSWFPGPPITAEGQWSLTRLALSAAAMVIGMACVGLLPLWASAIYAAAFSAFVLRTYPRASARIRRPSLWIELAAVMLLAGLLLGGARHGLAGMIDGLSAGAAMVLRATIVLFGFTAISVELRNPSILAFVERRGLRGLSDALGVAFAALPAFTSVLAEQRSLWRRPGQLIANLLQTASLLVAAGSAESTARSAVVITGATGSGKTTLTREVIERLRARGLRVAGILAPGILTGGRRTGFDLVNLATGEQLPLAREQGNPGGSHARWSRFAFSPEGLALGRRALTDDARGADVMVVDEVGPFELSGGGWAQPLDALAHGYGGALLLVVRESVVDAVRARWGAADTTVCDVADADPDAIADRLQQGSRLRAQGPG
jgi:nucleoside-triphosphatase THEP1